MKTEHSSAEATNKLIEILAGLTERLTLKHGVEPGCIARAYLAAAIELHLRERDSVPAAAQWLREMADELQAQDDSAEIRH